MGETVSNWIFEFGKRESIEEKVHFVTPDLLYSKSQSYGFVIEQNKRENKDLCVSECNSGFDATYWCTDEDITRLQQSEIGCYVSSKEQVSTIWDNVPQPGEDRLIPMVFRADVVEAGNYRVTISLQGESDDTYGMIFLGRRRLAFQGIIGTAFKKSFLCNVCDIIPRGYENVFSDYNVTVAIAGDDVTLCSIQIEKVESKTLYIMGDSTVTDQCTEYPYAPGTSYCGWGQMLSAYLADGVVVSNHAHSGLTTESNRSEGHYDIVKRFIKPGDYVFMQFGHNDQKLDHLKAYEGYQSNFKEYITEIREFGAYPVIVTPVARNSWKGIDGTYNDLLEEYAQSCIDLGKEWNVPVLDLHGLSKKFVVSMGLEAAKSYFYPGDFTHSNDYGAYKMAGFVAQQMKAVCGMKEWGNEYKFLHDQVNELVEWEAADSIALMQIPEKFAHKVNPNAPTELFSDLERPDDVLTRVEALDMVIKSARFFPTNVYNDMYVDVIGHEWYAGTVECAYQNGIIMDEMVEEAHFYPEKKVNYEDFLCFIMNGYKSRKKLPDASTSPYDAIAMPYALPYVKAAFALDVIGTNINLNAAIRRKQAAEICRKLHI